jgi:hypothetical protein
MDLTRFRRYLRDHHTLPATAARDLLDEVDLVHEDAEYYEQRMREQSSLSDEDMTGFVGENAERLTFALIRIMGIESLLQVIASETGYEESIEIMSTLKAELDEKEQASRKAIAELNEEPF